MRRHLLLFVFFLALAASAATIYEQAGQLPERVASHFDAHGHANGWMSRAAEVRAALCLALGAPLSVVGLCYLIRFLPAGCLQVPNASYWRAPENHPRACSMIFRSSLWLGAGMSLWAACLHNLIVTANRMQLPTLDGTSVSLLTITLVGGFFAWIVSLVFRLSHNP